MICSTTPSKKPKDSNGIARPKHVRGVQAYRVDIFARDNFTCQYCGADLLQDVQTLYVATVDHVIPKCRGGSSAPENLVASCPGCNTLKGHYPATTFEEAKEYVAVKRAEYAAYLKRLFAHCGVEVPTDRGGPTAAREDVASVLGTISDASAEIIGLLPRLQEMLDVVRSLSAHAVKAPAPEVPADDTPLNLAAILKATERTVEGWRRSKPERPKFDQAEFGEPARPTLSLTGQAREMLAAGPEILDVCQVTGLRYRVVAAIATGSRGPHDGNGNRLANLLPGPDGKPSVWRRGREQVGPTPPLP